MSLSCPTCSRDGFSGKKGLRIHHTQAHGERLGLKTVSCDHCGETFKREEWRLQNSEKDFCSKECQAGWRSESEEFAKSSWMWDGGVTEIELECYHCGDAITRARCKLRMYDRHFCSNQCQGRWRSENWSGDDTPGYKGGKITTECDWCGDEIVRHRSQVEVYERNFCNRECNAEWLSDNPPSQRPGHKPDFEFGRGPNWEVQRQLALERDNHRCQACGVTNSEHQKQYGSSLPVHHIVPFSDFSDYEEANVLKNLVTVCRNCHKAVENEPIGVGLRLRDGSPESRATPPAEATVQMQITEY